MRKVIITTALLLAVIPVTANAQSVESPTSTPTSNSSQQTRETQSTNASSTSGSFLRALRERIAAKKAANEKLRADLKSSLQDKITAQKAANETLRTDIAQTLKDNIAAQKEANEALRSDLKEIQKVKLDNVKKKICESNQSRIDKAIAGMNKRRQSSYDKITKSFDAVQAYYVEKKLSISSYDQLLSAAKAAQTAAETAMKSQQTSPQIDCSGDQPHADIETFKVNRSISVNAMQTYQQAVKVIVNAVKAEVEAQS